MLSMKPYKIKINLKIHDERQGIRYGKLFGV